MIIRRIPLNALQAGVKALLEQYQSTPVRDKAFSNTSTPITLPCITMGTFTYQQNGAKNSDIADISLELHIWSDSDGQAKINPIANDIMAVLTSWPIDLSVERFTVISQDASDFKAFPKEEIGYHGVLILKTKIQNLGVCE